MDAPYLFANAILYAYQCVNCMFGFIISYKMLACMSLLMVRKCVPFQPCDLQNLREWVRVEFIQVGYFKRLNWRPNVQKENIYIEVISTETTFPHIYMYIYIYLWLSWIIDCGINAIFGCQTRDYIFRYSLNHLHSDK